MAFNASCRRMGANALCGAIADLEGTPRRGADPAPRASSSLSHYGRPAWTKLYRRWLARLKFDQAVHHIVFEDYIAVEAAEARRDRLTAQIAAMLPDWTLAPVVAALPTMRGMTLVNAATLITELGDLSRFANPRAS
jgi:hypothetical protein